MKKHKTETKGKKSHEKQTKEQKENKKEELNEEENGEQENNTEEEQTSVEKLKQEIKELKDALLRKVAEFENYKRRTENEQLDLIKYGAESFILKILPIYDDLQRSVQHLEESNLDSIKDGLKLVLNKFTKTFEEQGIKKIDAKGKEFDVDFHDALLQQPSADVPPDTVLEEVEPGYTFKDKVIKHAKVIVSKEVEQSVEEKENNNNNDNEE